MRTEHAALPLDQVGATVCRTPDTDGVIFSPWKSIRWSILTTTYDFNVWISPVVVWVQQAQLGSGAIDGIGGLPNEFGSRQRHLKLPLLSALRSTSFLRVRHSKACSSQKPV